ncbi:hypothetical protein CDL15_Pgr001072 [Punica granatum]|nr:hypothetical protein CDL15_Pgr001072 [Punica granatum]
MGSSTSEKLLDRRHTLPSYNFDSNMDQVTEPVAVPFMWEKIPGIAKSRTEPEPQPLDRGFDKRSEDQVLTELLRSSEDSTKEGRDEMAGNGLEDDSDDSEVYSDALESLSSAESVSFSFNCSVSGLSGSDGSARKPPGTFSMDPRTRDLMMSRFLPAARAMALEPPQYTSRKQQQLAIVPYEQPKEVKREPVRDDRVLPKEYDSNIIQKYQEQDMGEEDESEDENNEVEDDYSSVQAKGCGLIPKLCLLNPIPGMKVRTQRSLSVHSKAKNASKGGYCQAENDPAAKNADYSCRSDRGTLTPRLLGSENLSAGGSRRFNFSGELQTMRGSLSPYRRSRTNNFLPQQNVENEHRSDREALSPRLRGLGAKPFSGRYRHFNYSGELRTMRGSLSPFMHSRADALSSQQNVDNEGRSHETLTPKLRGPGGKPFAGGSRPSNLSGELRPMRGSLSPYRHSTDAFFTQQKERSRSPLAGVGVCSFSKEVESTTRNSSRFPLEAQKDQVLQTSFGVEKTLYVDSINVARISYSNSNSSDQEVWVEPESETPLKRTEAREALSEQSISQELKSSENSYSSANGDLILSNYQNFKGDEKEDLNSDSLPPLLKSPSESWLYRTLPSIPSRSPLTPKKQSPKLSSHETKWETIVKSSNLHHDHVRYSEELITHVTQKPKTKS